MKLFVYTIPTIQVITVAMAMMSNTNNSATYHYSFMQTAISLAKQAASLDEVPVGAIIVDAQGAIIGRGYNAKEHKHSPLLHAELTAIEQASHTLQRWRLHDCTLYSTLEPCIMCTGAIIQARIKELVFGAWDKKSGACGGFINIFEIKGLNHYPIITSGVLAQECSLMLTSFFDGLRQRHKDKA